MTRSSGSGYYYSPGINTKNPGALQQPIGTAFDHRKYIHLFAESFNDPTLNVGMNIMAGDTGPAVTDGYAQWSLVARPLRVGLMVFTGRNPPALTIPVRFVLFDNNQNWLRDSNAALTIEQQIHTLEWMAGESIGSGPSPLVYPSTYDNHGNTTPLIPFQYQADSPSALRWSGGDSSPWIITSLAWGDADRNDDMQRTRQDCTITLTYYIPQTTQTQAGPRPKAMTVTSGPGMDTALLIARSVASNNPPLLAQVIIEYQQNKQLQLRSVNQAIKHGRRVYVPPSNKL